MWVSVQLIGGKALIEPLGKLIKVRVQDFNKLKNLKSVKKTYLLKVQLFKSVWVTKICQQPD